MKSKFLLLLTTAVSVSTSLMAADTASSAPCQNTGAIIDQLSTIKNKVDALLQSLKDSQSAPVDISPTAPSAPIVPSDTVTPLPPSPAPTDTFVPDMTKILPISKLHPRDSVTVNWVNDIRAQLVKISKLTDPNRTYSLMRGSGGTPREPIKLTPPQAAKVLKGFDDYVRNITTNTVDASFNG